MPAKKETAHFTPMITAYWLFLPLLLVSDGSLDKNINLKEQLGVEFAARSPARGREQIYYQYSTWLDSGISGWDDAGS